jgi:hypothetical protein
MSASQVSKEILKHEPRIKFVSIAKDGSQDTSISQNIKIDENEIKLSINQTPHLIESGKRFTDLGTLESVVFNYEHLKIVNLPLTSEVVICGTSNDLNIDEIKAIVSNHVSGYDFKKEAKYGDKKPETRSELEEKGGIKDQALRSPNENPIQTYVITMIEFWKEFSINSIKMNEKFVKEFWKTFKDI